MTQPHLTPSKASSVSGAEISWFAPICDGDDDFLGTRNDRYKSNWENTAAIVRQADVLGYRNILCPSSYQVGQDTLSFAAAIAPQTQQINLLTAIRCGEVHPPMLARAIATLDHMLKGRLTLNIISSNLPGAELESEARYQRSREVITILKQAWNEDFIDFHGDFYDLHLPTAPVKPYQQKGGPMLYFGGYSPAGIELCAQHCDVYLMWPEIKEKLKAQMETLSAKAAAYHRTLDFGLRVHVIVRETEKEARQYADLLISKLDITKGTEIRERAQDANSLGVSKQNEMRAAAAADHFVEPHLWTGIGLARSGCGAALVGNPQQILGKINDYMSMGIRSFIFSGYPHHQEAQYFAKWVLPHLKTISLPKLYGKIPQDPPNTPLGKGPRF
jgi:alkanesulfonate monooxygenase